MKNPFVSYKRTDESYPGNNGDIVVDVHDLIKTLPNELSAMVAVLAYFDLSYVGWQKYSIEVKIGSVTHKITDVTL